MQAHLKKTWYVLLALVLSFQTACIALAQTSSSTNYKIISDSVTNCGGGFSSSTNYKVFDTLCESGLANSSSTNYGLQSGFQSQQDLPSLTVSYSATSLSFGSITSNAIATSTMSVTVTTNANNGYAISILADGHLRKTTAETTTTSANEIISQVSDGTVTLGGNEYGFSTSTTDLAIPTSTPAIVNVNTGWASAETTTINFEIAAGPNSSSGSYTQTLTVIVTGAF